MRRMLMAAAIAAAFAAVQPGAAAAQTYSTSSTTTQGQYELNQGANARVLASDADSVTISLECFANGSPQTDIISIGIQACYVVGTDGTRHDATFNGATPGFVTATAGLFHDVRRQHYRVCVDSNMFARQNFVIEAPLRCSS